MELLLALGEMRQTTISAETQAIYAAALAQYDLRHVEAVVMRLGHSPRGEYEKAIPELGELEAMVKKEQAKSRPPFVACGKCMNGIVLVNAQGQPWKFSIDGHEHFAKECDCKKIWRETA